MELVAEFFQIACILLNQILHRIVLIAFSLPPPTAFGLPTLLPYYGNPDRPSRS
jgi:hypothetical protein